ncbi:MAG: hypothetical protein ACE5JL_03950 [Dehalococcoidia bacterium]
MRLLLPVVLIAGLLLVLSACDAIAQLEQEPAPTPTSTPISTATTTPTLSPTTSPLEILQQSIERQREIKSFRSKMDLVSRVEEQGLALSIGVEFDMEMDQDRRMRMATVADTPVGRISAEVIISGLDMYVKPPDEGWVRLAGALEELTEQSLYLFPDFQRSFFDIQEIPWELYSVTFLGREQVNEIDTSRLQVQVDFAKLWERQPDEMRQFLESVSSENVQVEFLDELIQQTELKTLDFWIDDQGYARRAFIEINIGDTMFIEMDQRMFDINESFVIELPQDYSEG